MNTKIHVKQSSILDPTKDYAALGTNLMLLDSSNIEISTDAATGTTTYLIEKVKPGMFTNEEFIAILYDTDAYVENIQLYAPVLATVLDELIPETFPYSKTADVVNEDESVTEGEQLKVKEYFNMNDTDGTKAVIKLTYRRAGATSQLTEDYPDSKLFLEFLGWIQLKLIGVIMTEQGKKTWKDANFVKEEI